MKSRFSIGLVATALLGLACGGGGAEGSATGGLGTNPISPVPPPPPGTMPPPAPPPEEERIQPPIGTSANFDIVDDSFVDDQGRHDQEAEATVKVGQKVSWTQNGFNTHRVEFSQAPKNSNALDSGDLRSKRIYEFRPNKPGKYVFFCRYHEYMMDVVINVVEN